YGLKPSSFSNPKVAVLCSNKHTSFSPILGFRVTIPLCGCWRKGQTTHVAASWLSRILVNHPSPFSIIKEDVYSWRHQLREFKSEYRVVALDLRGYGETDAPPHKENYKLDCLIADIKDILESLGYNKCVLIGHDWGGMIAWLVAICYPEMVTKLIVVNFPHPSVFTEYILRHPSQLIKSGYYFFFQMPWFPEFMFTLNDFKVLKSLFTSQATGIGRKGCRLTAEDIEAYLYVFSQPGALTGPINHYRTLFSCLPLQHHEVIMPTLLLWGERDAFMEVEMAEITRIYVKNHFRLTILSEASHWLQQDQPDIVNKLIWTFLKEETKRKRE
ncbi:hypothetical protein DV515_00004920, partial [Chloebia gouldiae]